MNSNHNHHFQDTSSLNQGSINSIEPKSEPSDMIFGRPSFIIRWGIIIFFIILLLIVSASWFISYPEVILTNAKLTSINPPKEVITKTVGKLDKLFAVEGQDVKVNEVLGYLESRANPAQVISLSQYIDSLQISIINNDFKNLNSVSLVPYLNLGEAQQSYQAFIQSFSIFKQHILEGYYVQKKNMLIKDLQYLDKMEANLIQQHKQHKEDFELQKETFKANEYLLKEKVISRLEYRTERSKLISKEMSLPQISSNILTNRNNKNEKQKEIMELENQIAQQKLIFLQSLNTFKAQLDDWKAKFLLTAPISGKVAFASSIQENQQLQSNQTFCYINPGNSQYYAEMFIPQKNFGKVKKYQKVLLQLPSYNFHQYGKLEGKLDFIYNIPNDSGYQAKVNLPNGLITNFNKRITYQEGLIAKGEIITADMRLLERLYYSFRSKLYQ